MPNEEKIKDQVEETKADEIVEEAVSEEAVAEEPAVEEERPARQTRRRRRATEHISYNPADVITVEKNGEINSPENDMDRYWEELRTSMKRKKIISGTLSSTERMRISEDMSLTVAIVDFHGYRVVIPLNQMNIIIEGNNAEGRMNKIIASMLGGEIDFIVTAMSEENGVRSVTASRKQAMEQKVKTFYIDNATATGEPIIQEGSVVEARVLAVSETAVRIEVFGTECFVRSSRLDAAWIPDAREKYHVGDKILVRMESIKFTNGTVRIEVEGRSLRPEDTFNCSTGGRYLGIVTGANEGTYFIRLKAGVNAIAYQYEGSNPLPKKKDEVAFVCTRMDVEAHLAVGIVTRVIRRAK